MDKEVPPEPNYENGFVKEMKLGERWVVDKETTRNPRRRGTNRRIQ